MVLLLAACTGAGGPAPDGSGPTTQAVPGPVTEPPGEPATAEPDGDAAPLGALEAYLAVLDGDGDREAAHREREELVAACMRAEGFEYVPVPYAGDPAGWIEPDDGGLELYTVEFAERYGYDRATRRQDAVVAAPPEGWADPNVAVVDAMSDAEREAYHVAMSGSSVAGADGEQTGHWYDPETSGCEARAQFESSRAVEEAAIAFEGLMTEIGSALDAHLIDPRVAELDAAWASCMADAGYPGLDVAGDAEWLVIERVNAVRGDQWPGEEDAETLAALDEVGRFEIDVAVADAECRAGVRYAETIRALDLEYQQSFVDQHRDELDAWLAAATDR